MNGGEWEKKRAHEAIPEKRIHHLANIDDYCGNDWNKIKKLKTHAHGHLVVLDILIFISIELELYMWLNRIHDNCMNTKYRTD